MKGLNKLYYLKLEIDNIKKEIRGLAEISSSKLTGMPRGGGVSQPIEQYLMKKEKLIERLEKKIEKYYDELNRIENIIDEIEDIEVKAIARLRYIHNLKWEEIGKKISLDRSTCYRKLNKYLEGNKKNKKELKNERF